MIRYEPGDLIGAGSLGSVLIYNDFPGPTIKNDLARAIGKLKQSDVGIVLRVIDDNHVLIVTQNVVGVVLLKQIKAI